ncbi:MAG: glycosyltransferase family 4 protein [Candidatus Sulfotelmatobacter sp.]|jgi:UDP-glucose:(heptosyl)LPS alpha-1,3-glucosyltransferase
MPGIDKPRIAVVSPFLDKRHGTERCVAEQVERLARDYEVHLYSNRVEDVDLSQMVWHRVPALPGPHLFAYSWWFAANHFQRWWDARFRGLKYELLYMPGINCLDGNVISVHIVFAEFYERVRAELSLPSNPVKIWPTLIHRRMYYALVKLLERRTYTRKDLPLVVVSHKVAADLQRFYGRSDNLSVAYHGWDRERLGPASRSQLRDQARCELGLQENHLALLLVGNDWKKKGLPCLLEAVGRLSNPELRVLVVGNDTKAPYLNLIQRAGLEERVQFLPLRRDVEFYYATADAYVGPSLEDAFAMPPLEAMACGVPVIVSRQAGVSEVITHGTDGLVLEDAEDAAALSLFIHELYADADLRKRLGENAANTALKYTWEGNAEQLRVIFDGILTARSGTPRCPATVRC